MCYSRATSLVECQVAIASRRRLIRCAVGAPVVLVGARRCRAHVRKLLSGRAMRPPTVASVLLGAKRLCRWFASLSSGARACAHVSQVPLRARDGRAHARMFPLGRAMRAPMSSSSSPGAKVAPIIASFSAVRLSGAQGARPRIAVAGGGGRSADFARGSGIAAKGM